jgi:peptidoglycan/LPS O-acetylase OafA/YrhL
MRQSLGDSRSSFMPQLDALRAFAVASVAYSHWVPEQYHFGLPLGTVGVQLFFILSGFLITKILFSCRHHGDPIFALRAFYMRRLLRIFPLFYAVIAVALVLGIPPVRETLFWHLGYLSNIYFFLNQSWDGAVSHFWSLAVEEQFYLFWPAVVLFLPATCLRAAVFVLIAIGLFSRFVLPSLFPAIGYLYVLPNSNFDALGLGALLAFMFVRGSGATLVRVLFWAIPVYFILLMAGMLRFSFPWLGELRHLFMILSFSWLIAKASVGFQGGAKRILEMPGLLYLGKISYGLYVLHNFASVPVSFLASRLGIEAINQGILNFLALTFFTVAGASASWHLFEHPIVRLKQYFPYARPRDSFPGGGAPIESLSLT